MHSFVILMVYLTMLLSPCVVAQWGDLLVMPRWNIFGARRRQRMADPVYAMMVEAQAEAQLRRVMREAFIAPAALPGFGTAPATLAEALEQVTYRDSFAAATARVGARLQQMAAARKAELAAAAAVPAAADVPVPAFALPASIFDSGSSIPTPTVEQLRSLVAEPSPVPTLVAALERSDGHAVESSDEEFVDDFTEDRQRLAA